MFTLYSADFIGNPGNCSYPHKTVVMDADRMRDAVSHDYVCAEYKNHYRNSDNFLSADCLPVDCDNDHSEDPKDWITPADVLEAFPGVSLAIHYSRFNQREKNGKPARPKFHVLFPIDRVTDAALYSDMKKLVNSIFPYFDTKALDAARFFFGTQEPNVELYPGRMNLTDFLNDDECDADLPGGHEKDIVIPEGSRNATMSRFAGIVIKKYGDTEKAYQSFLEKAATCVPPLDNSELNTIWHSAQRFIPRSAVRTDMSLQRSTTMRTAICRRTSPTSGKPRCSRSILQTSCATHRPPTSSATATTIGRKRSPALRPSPMS
jgi:hypothetical protein